MEKERRREREGERGVKPYTMLIIANVPLSPDFVAFQASTA